MACIKLMPKIAYKLAVALYEANRTRNPRMEAVIAHDPEWAYWYALNVLKGPWPEAEAVITRDSQWGTWYIRDILKKPWPDVKLAITQDPERGYWYICEALRTEENKTRFEETQHRLASEAPV